MSRALSEWMGHPWAQRQGDHVLWVGRMIHNTPVYTYRPQRREPQVTRSMRGEVYEAAYGERPKRLKTSCGLDNCIAPEHLFTVDLCA